MGTNELEQAIEMLRKEYEKASNTRYVKNPLSWALYHVWKKVDEMNEKNKEGK